jgi:hypothetical protein
VIFSNGELFTSRTCDSSADLVGTVIREEIKDQKLSFTDIAKTVGERWQSLSSEEKKAFEQRAAGVKEDYNTKLAEYKLTDSYTEYQRYLDDFKAKNSASCGKTSFLCPVSAD